MYSEWRWWYALFYPKPASETTPVDALDHSIQKWEGLVTYGAPLDFEPGGSSCALCHHFTCDSHNDGTDRAVTTCPLALSRHGVPCDKSTLGERVSPWGSWEDGNGAPMLAALRKAKADQP